jgi:hypothetical protein
LEEDMRTLFVFPVTLVVIFALSCGCSEDNPSIVGVGGAPSRVAMPYNSSNPFDSVGIKHNQMLEFLVACLPVDTSGDVRASAIANGIDALGDSVGWSSEQCDIYINMVGQHFIADRDSTFHDQYISDYSAPNCTQRELNYIHEIGSVIANATDSSGLMNGLLALETDIIAENWDDEETIALEAISIAKHSMYHALHTKLMGDCLGAEIHAGQVDFTAYLHARDESEECLSEEEAGRIGSVHSAVAYALYICLEHWPQR